MKANQQLKEMAWDAFDAVASGDTRGGLTMTLNVLGDAVPETPEEEQARADAIADGRRLLAEAE